MGPRDARARVIATAPLIAASAMPAALAALNWRKANSRSRFALALDVAINRSETPRVKAIDESKKP